MFSVFSFLIAIPKLIEMLGMAYKAAGRFFYTIFPGNHTSDPSLYTWKFYFYENITLQSNIQALFFLNFGIQCTTQINCERWERTIGASPISTGKSLNSIHYWLLASINYVQVKFGCLNMQIHMWKLLL